MEQTLIAWFAAHPFIRTELVLILGAWGSYAERDWAEYKKSVLADQTLTFSWRAHLRIYPHVALIAVLPPFVAEVWHILNAAGAQTGSVAALLVGFF